MGELDVRLKGKSLADYTNTQLRMALGAVLYTNTADMWDKYLKSLGYSGSVSAMLEKYYVDYAIPTQFRNYINAGAAINNPQNLFADGGVGFVYDNNDYVNPTLWRRNLLTYSEQFNNAAWLKQATGTGVIPVVTANFGVAPDGTTTADRIVFDLGATPASAYSRVGQFNLTTNTSIRSKSIWLKTTDGSTKTLYFQGPQSGQTILTVTGTWTRFSVSDTTAQVAAYAQMQFGLDATTSTTASILAWGAQLEENAPAPTEYQRITDFNSDFLAAYPNTTLFVDSAGTQPALVNGLVGLQLDKSQGLVLGAELSSYSTGFSSTAGITANGVTVSLSSGSLLITATSTDGVDRAEIPISGLTVGKYYLVTVVARRGVQGTQQSVRSSTCFDIPFFPILTTSATTYTYRTAATATSGVIRVYAADGPGAIGDEVYVNSISVRELPGNHRYQTTTGSKPILRGTPVGSNLVTNGDFASGTGWIPNTWVISGGSATATNVSDSLAQNYTFTAGNVYRVTFTVSAFSGTGGVRPRFFGGTTVTGTTRSATGTYVEYLTAVTGNTQFALASTTTTATITVDNVEIVDVSAGAVTAPYGLQYDGIDDFLTTASVDFATATSDGLARRNLLTVPSAFDNAVWGKTRSSISANVTTAPDGTTTADKLVEDTTASNNHHIAQAVTTGAGAYTFTIYAKAGERFRFILEHSASPQPQVVFNVQIGEVVSNSGSPTSFSITPVGNGWYRCQMTATLSTSGSFRVFLQDASGNTNYTGDGTSGIFIWGAQLETGTTASTFQDIGTDKMAVVMGVRKLAQGVRQMLVEHNGGSLPGFSIEAPGASGTGYRVSSGGSVLAQATTTGYDDVISRVTSGAYDIAGDSAILRVNGTAVSTAATDQGTGNYVNAVFFFGRRGGSSLPMNGLDFGGVCVGKSLTATQLANVEKWVSLRTGVTL